MKHNHLQLALILTVFSLLLPLGVARADLGPKPTMQFNFKFQGQPTTIVGGQQLECSDPTCADGKPLQVGGPQRFTCDAGSCHSLAYGYAPYHKLVIQFADRTRESNVFQHRAFNAVYTVTVTDSALQVEEDLLNTIGPLAGGPYQGIGFSAALIITVVVETVVAGVYLLLARLRGSVLLWVLLANLISLPAVWFLFPRLSLPSTTTIVLAEAVTVVFEAVFVYFLSRKALSFRQAFLMSVLMNVASYVLGFFLV